MANEIGRIFKEKMEKASQIKIPQIRPKIPNFSAMQQEINEQLQTRQEELHGFAHIIFEKLMIQIREFEKELNEDEEIAAYLSSFGNQILINIDKVGYQNPHLIIFYGINANTGDKVQLVQHCSQVNVLFTVYNIKPEEKRSARRIGFIQED